MSSPSGLRTTAPCTCPIVVASSSTSTPAAFIRSISADTCSTTSESADAPGSTMRGSRLMRSTLENSQRNQGFVEPGGVVDVARTTAVGVPSSASTASLTVLVGRAGNPSRSR
jgi:hypothetical protein